MGYPDLPSVGYDATDDEIKEKLFNKSSDIWQYNFYELFDPANPYKLIIEFDEAGNATDMSFEVIPSG